VSAIVTRIESVEPYGENLSIVTTKEGNQVIANKREDGSFRWAVNDRVAYVSEGSILPEDVLKERGYWDEEKDRGLLDGGKRNRVKMKKLAGFESRGLLFRADMIAGMIDVQVIFKRGGATSEPVREGDDVSEFFGITEFQG
jgi:hypothetical protein